MKVFIFTFLCVASRHILMTAWFNSSKEVHKHAGIDSVELGVIDMSFLLMYAIGNFILGVLGDSFRQKRVLCLSSFVSCLTYFSVIFNQIIFLSYLKAMNFYSYIILFSVLGFTQSAIWPMTVAIMGVHYSKEVRGSIIGFWSVNSAAGDMIGYFLSSLLISAGLGWVVVSSVSLCIFTIVILGTFFFLPDAQVNEIIKPRISVLDAIRLPTVLYYCACYACIKFIHLSIMIWVPYYMYETIHIETKIGGIIMVLYSVGGIIGGISSGFISDRVSDRSYVLLAMIMGSVPMISLLNFELGNSELWSFVFIFVVGFLISGGSNFLSGVIAADMCELNTEFEAKSTLTGLVDASGGIGAAIGQLIVRFI